MVSPIKKENVYRDSKYPCIGTDEERKSYVLYFNQLAKQKCLENGWICSRKLFINILHKMDF